MYEMLGEQATQVTEQPFCYLPRHDQDGLMSEARTVWRCDECNRVVAERQGESLVVHSRHNGDWHTTRIPISDLTIPNHASPNPISSDRAPPHYTRPNVIRQHWAVP